MSRTFFVKHWKSIPRPTCCEQIVEHPIIHLSSVTVNGEPESPKWFMTCETPYPRNVHKDKNQKPNNQFSLCAQGIQMSRCPFCGTRLPEVELKSLRMPQKICVITDGGYYCDTCNKRLDSCRCYPSEAKYKAMYKNMDDTGEHE